MKRICIILGAWLALLAQAPAYGQAGALFDAFKVEASLPLQFSTNALQTPTNVQSDFWSSPSLKLSALRTVDSSLGYQIYFYSNPEPYRRVHAAEDAAETFGARFDKTLDKNFSTGAYYEHTFIFNGLYQSTAYQANDFAGFVGYTYEDKKAGFSFAPVLTAAYRAADDVSQDRFSLKLKADITQKLPDNWKVTVTPGLRYYGFTDGTNAGAWTLLSFLVAELDYNINDDVALGWSVEFDRQRSNVAANNFTNVIFLASISFGHTYDLPPKKKRTTEWRKIP